MILSSNKKAKPIYTPQELALLDLQKIPKHIAIIPDGNRRWAKRYLFSPEKGHQQGAEAVTAIVNAAISLGIKVITIYSFSTENWQRPKREITLLMHLLKSYLIKQRPNMIRDGVRLNTIGTLTAFPPDLVQVVNDSKAATSHGTKIDLVLALNYGGRDEIRRAIHSIIDDYEAQRVKKESLTEELIGRYLDTARWKDPDLLIRTSGEQRVSNFLLWQISYSEIYTTPVLWPDFSSKHLLEALIDYQKRERRIGGA